MNEPTSQAEPTKESTVPENTQRPIILWTKPLPEYTDEELRLMTEAWYALGRVDHKAPEALRQLRAEQVRRDVAEHAPSDPPGDADTIDELQTSLAEAIAQRDEAQEAVEDLNRWKLDLIGQLSSLRSERDIIVGQLQTSNEITNHLTSELDTARDYIVRVTHRLAALPPPPLAIPFERRRQQITTNQDHQSPPLLCARMTCQHTEKRHAPTGCVTCGCFEWVSPELPNDPARPDLGHEHAGPIERQAVLARHMQAQHGMDAIEAWGLSATVRTKKHDELHGVTTEVKP